MSAIIDDVIARKVFDCRGDETIEIDVVTVTSYGRASAPSGVSRGRAEVVPYPEGGIDEAIKKVDELIAPEVVGMDASEQREVDELLHSIDGTRDFSKIGGNAAFAISLATADAAASSYGLPIFQQLSGYLAEELPYPLGNVMSGGKHALGRAPDVQEYLVLPIGAPSFSDAAKANALVHRKLKDLLEDEDPTFVGGKSDEGAWVCSLSNEGALEVLMKACEGSSKELGLEIKIGLDLAASTLWNPKKGLYEYKRDGMTRSPEEQLEFVLSLIKAYDLIYVEDPFHEDSFDEFVELTKEAKGCLICGDDLFATNRNRLSYGVKRRAANSLIIKVNQVGTLTDAWEAVKLAKENKYAPVISHRSGDTIDSHIAHLAVAFNCPIIKTGVVEGSRIAKINELIRIEELLGHRARLARLPL